MTTFKIISRNIRKKAKIINVEKNGDDINKKFTQIELNVAIKDLKNNT